MSSNVHNNQFRHNLIPFHLPLSTKGRKVLATTFFSSKNLSTTNWNQISRQTPPKTRLNWPQKKKTPKICSQLLRNLLEIGYQLWPPHRVNIKLKRKQITSLPAQRTKKNWNFPTYQCVIILASFLWYFLLFVAVFYHQILLYLF